MREPMNKKIIRPCPEKEKFLRAFMGELTEAEYKDFLGHVSSCPDCRRVFEALTQLQAQLKARESVIEDKEVSAEQMRELRRLAKQQVRELSKKRAPLFLRPLAVGLVALAAGLVLLFVGYFFLLRNHSSDQTLRGKPREELRLIKPERKPKGAPSVFLWTDVKGRDSFRFEIIDDELNTLYINAVTGTKLELPAEVKQQIVKGKVYLWTIEVYDDNGKKLASASRYFEIE